MKPIKVNRTNQNYDGQQGYNHEKMNKKRRIAIILGVIAILFLLLMIVFAPTVIQDVKNYGLSLPKIDRKINRSEGENDLAYDTEVKEETELLQEEVAKNTLNARIASALQPDHTGRMYLSLKNKYEDKLLQVVIVNEETQEVYYKSPVLEPLTELEYDQIINQPMSGEYSCIAYFYYYTINEEPISQVGAKIKLIIE